MLAGDKHSSLFFPFVRWAQECRVLDYYRLGMLAGDKHTSLLGPFLSCKENKGLWIQPQLTSFLVVYFCSISVAHSILSMSMDKTNFYSCFDVFLEKKLKTKDLRPILQSFSTCN
jgi:hypothetical protein